MPLGAKICKSAYSECDELLRESCEVRKECRGYRVKGSIHGEIRISSSSFTILCLEVLHILLRTLTFYKARKSTWPTMKKALFERHTSTNIINTVSMSCANGDARFYNKVAATKSNHNFIWSKIT